MPLNSPEKYQQAKDALGSVQKYDVEELPRESELGTQMGFREAVEPASNLISLFSRLSILALEDFPDQSLDQIKEQSNNTLQLFAQIKKFNPTENNAHGIRQDILNNLKAAYRSAFQILHPYIAYSLHRSADFQRLDTQARATLQEVETRAADFETKINARLDEAANIIKEMRDLAAEEGVTQQAVHFRKEAEHHDEEAKKWQKKTVSLAWILGGFAVCSVALHKIPWLTPQNSYETTQLVVSKILIFSVITYMLVLASRNFLSHRHNSIVNRHRQNALMTHRALVEGTNNPSAQDAVMVHAANCVFSPQPTGYASGQGDGDAASSRSVIEILSKPFVNAMQDKG